MLTNSEESIAYVQLERHARERRVNARQFAAMYSEKTLRDEANRIRVYEEAVEHTKRIDEIESMIKGYRLMIKLDEVPAGEFEVLKRRVKRKPKVKFIALRIGDVNPSEHPAEAFLDLEGNFITVSEHDEVETFDPRQLGLVDVQIFIVLLKEAINRLHNPA